MSESIGWAAIIVGALGAAVAVAQIVVANRRARGRRLYRAWMKGVKE